MRDNFTSITVLLDASGSMQPLAKETISGFNAFLTEQQALPGEAVLTLATFSYPLKYRLVYDCTPLSEVQPLTPETYSPNGGTALLDAIGRTVNTLGTRLAAMKEEDRPSKVLFIIMTDGEENASLEFVHEKVMEMINHQRDKYSWEFCFMGANQDAIKAGASIGITRQNTYSYNATKGGTRDLFASVNQGTSSYRSATIGSAYTMPDPTAATVTNTTPPVVDSLPTKVKVTTKTLSRKSKTRKKAK